MSVRIRAAAAAAALVAATAASAASAAQTFTDPVGDAPPTTDMTSVVASDDAQGGVRLQVAIPGLQALTPTFRAVVVIDSDMSPLTGSQDPDIPGFDWMIVTDGSVVTSLRWSGSTFERVDIVSTHSPPSAALAAGVLTLTLPAGALGIDDGFRYGVATGALSGETLDPASVDSAPGAGMWTYLMGPPRLVVVLPALLPRHPAAAGRFTAGMLVRRAATGKPAAKGTVACRFAAGGHAVPGVHGAVTASGLVTCVGRVPASASGRPLRGTVEYTYRGRTIRQTFSARVR